MQLTDLPTEILIKILQCLRTSDLAKEVSLVSKLINVLSKDSSIGIAFNFNDSTTEKRAKTIFKFRSNQIFYLFLSCARVPILKVVTDNISLLTNIKRLEIWDDEYKVSIPKTFLEQLSQLKKLKRLAIQSRFEKSSLNEISKCKHLKTLAITPKYYDISERDFRALASLGNRTQIYADFLFCTLNLNPEATLGGSPSACGDMTLKHHLTVTLHSMSLLEMMLSHFPSLGTIVTYGDLPLDTHANLRTLHSLLLSCNNLSRVEIKSSFFNETIFKTKFIGWNFKYNNETKNLSILSKPEQ